MAGNRLVPKAGASWVNPQTFGTRPFEKEPCLQPSVMTNLFKALRAVVQKYEDDANQIELSDHLADRIIRKTNPPDGWVSTALSEIETGNNGY